MANLKEHVNLNTSAGGFLASRFSIHPLLPKICFLPISSKLSSMECSIAIRTLATFSSPTMVAWH